MIFCICNLLINFVSVKTQIQLSEKMKKMLFLYYFVMLISGFWSCNAEAQITEPLMPEVGVEYKYLALGDSYTIGHGETTAQTFPFLLQEKLKAQNFIFPSDPKVIARTGWTCDELAAAILKDSTLTSSYDLVSLLIGVNDQYRGFDINLYPARFKKLLDTAIALAGNKADRVIVVSIPDYGVTPFGKQRNSNKISQEIDAYNAINKDIALQNGAKYVNITDISRLAENDISLLVSDKLHPSGKMYDLWANDLLPVASNILKR